MRLSFLATVSLSALAAAALPAAALAAPKAVKQARPAPAAPVSDTISAVRVEGNQRIEAQTIETYLGLHRGDSFDQLAIDKGMKALFATGFFSDVKLLRDNSDLIVRVTENPVINRVAFEGNDRVETKDLEKEVDLKSRSIYTRAKVQSDVKRILDIYRRSGRYTATVEPKIIALDQNRMDLVYEINEGPVSRVEKIAFIGNNTFSSSVLQGVIRTSEERWYQFLSDNDKYDPDRLEYDKELLRRYYVSQGYADFQVKSAHAELSPNRDAFYLTFVIEEGPQYSLNSVNVQSALKGEDGAGLEKLVTTKIGDTYDATRSEESVDAMTKELGNRGYAFVEITPRLKRNRDNNTIDLTYEVKPGPRVYIERINITGNVRTLDEVIRREFRVAEGDPYNTAKLARTEQRLNNLGFFEKVKITNEPGSTPDRTVINVDVQEKSTGEINLGAGFSSTDGALGDVGVKESNFLGRGQELRSRVTYAARRKEIDLGFTEPYFLNRELSAGVDVFKQQLDYQSESSYDINSKGGSLRLGYALREKLNHSLYYTLRTNDITDVQPTASLYVQRQLGEHTNSAVGHAITYDDRNNKFDPSSGYYLKFSQEVAGLGGDSKYIKHEVKTSYYYPVAKNWTFSVLGSAGNVTGFGKDIFITDRFYIGGETIRGFDTAGIGPRDSVTRDALGGNNYYSGTMEQSFPLGLPEDLGIKAAAFVDAASLWGADDSGPGIYDSNDLRVSAGVGLAWASPFGPVRIDVAKPLVKQNVDDTELFRFNFGTRF